MTRSVHIFLKKGLKRAKELNNIKYLLLFAIPLSKDTLSFNRTRCCCSSASQSELVGKKFVMRERRRQEDSELLARLSNDLVGPAVLSVPCRLRSSNCPPACPRARLPRYYVRPSWIDRVSRALFLRNNDESSVATRVIPQPFKCCCSGI